MDRGGRTITRRWPDTPTQRSRLGVARDDLVLETAPVTAEDGVAEDADGWRFAQHDGPFSAYERTVEREADELVETTRYRVVIPWFGWLFRWPVRRVIARRGSHRAWWAPPDRLDPTQVLVIGLLAAASMSAAFVNTLFTQTVNFAADDFGVSDTGIGIAGAVVRAGIVIALPAAVIADRIGRRRVIVAVAWIAPIVSVLGALAPSFVVLTATQTIARPMGIALAFLVGVVASEEMPRNSRAYAVSILAMAAGFGAGVAVLSLRLADLGEGGWRYVYVVGAVWCVVALDLSRRLPETRRFTAHHVASPSGRSPRLNRKRFALLAVVAFAGSIFVAPASFFQNRYLTDVRDFTGGMIGVFSIAVGTPAALGLILGGRFADTSGRRRLIAITLPLGTAFIVGAFAFGGTALWAFALLGGILSSASYPALAVYRTELFPTGNRTRATSLVTAASLIGGIGGLILTGSLLDGGWSYAAVMGTLAIGQVVVTVLVVLYYPETAHQELETLNPEDIPIDLHDPARPHDRRT
ncbi:MAG TPA: MFS transporter [Ilumatobacteraceae bacterium]|nr:MFS transporter [Ilumatobacteraceae bacterium]